jgi:hypothetical protein
VSAAEAHARGWSVFPVGGQNRKRPLVKWREHVATPESIARWSARRVTGYGIDCGRSGLVVLDEDQAGALAALCEAHGATLPETFTVATGGKGRHLYYQAPEGIAVRNSASVLADGLDVRAAGGYVVGPGSLHASGATYTTEDDRDPVPLPQWVAALIRSREHEPAFGTSLESTYTEATTEAGRAALSEAVAKIKAAPQGSRNDTLNAQAFHVFGRVKGGLIERSEALDALRDAADDCGLAPSEVEATLASAAQGAKPVGPRAWFPDLPDDAEQDAEQVGVSGNDEWTEAEERRIETEARLIRIRTEAKRRAAEADVPQSFVFEGGTLDEIWTGAPDPAPLVERLLPEGGNLLLTAQRKSGKTTLVLNLAESLTTGKPFLGMLDTKLIAGRVGFLNYELTPGILTAYSRGLVTNPSRVVVVNLLGRTNPLASNRGRAALAQHLREHDVEVLIVDPFSGAAAGVDENSNSEVRQWLDELHRWAMEDVGVRALVLSNHAGWAADRSRGASSLEDWANVLGLLTLADKENKASPRFFSAFGRLGELPEDRLDYNETTKALTMSGVGGRRKAKAAATAASLVPRMLSLVTDVPASGNKIIERATDAGVRGSREARLAAIRELVASGRIVNASTGKYPLYRLGKPFLDFDPADFPDEFPDHAADTDAHAPQRANLFYEDDEDTGSSDVNLLG